MPANEIKPGRFVLRRGRFCAFLAGGIVLMTTSIAPGSLYAQYTQYPQYPQNDRRPWRPYNQLQPLLNQIDKFQDTARTAPMYYNQGGYDMLWREFQALRRSYTGFKGVLSDRQLYEGANDLADLDSGLDIIQEAFTNYQSDAASTYASSTSFRNLCTVLSRSVNVWAQQLRTDWGRMQTVW